MFKEMYALVACFKLGVSAFGDLLLEIKSVISKLYCFLPLELEVISNLERRTNEC